MAYRTTFKTDDQDMQVIKSAEKLQLEINHNSEGNANYYQHCMDSPISYPGSVEQPEFLDSPSPRLSEDYDYRKRLSNATTVGQSPSSSPVISIVPSSNCKSDPLESNPSNDHQNSPQLNETKSHQQSPILLTSDAVSRKHSRAENQSSNITDCNNDPLQNNASKETTRDRNKTLSFDTAVTRTDSLITSPDSDHPSSPPTNPLMSSSRKLNANQISMFEAKPYVPKQKIVRNNTQK